MIHLARIDEVFGVLHIDGKKFCDTIERLRIPAGEYGLILTISNRVLHGSLWSPWKDGSLPLVLDVPGREGIRIHAGNKPADSSGCILIGIRQGDVLTSSRATLLQLRALLGFPVPLKITDPA